MIKRAFQKGGTNDSSPNENSQKLKARDVLNTNYGVTEAMLEHVSAFREFSSTKVTLC